jgi:endonuclease-3
MDDRKRVGEIITILRKRYPKASTALVSSSPLELLIATILSAQCTDKRVNIVTKELFKKYRTAEDYANADLAVLEQEIRSTGFYRNKARNIRDCGRMLVERFGSEVPKTMEELIELPGVARKTANIVLGHAYGIAAGIAVDTHVRRVAGRLEFTHSEDPGKIEQDLMRIVPKDSWMEVTDLLILHGRETCDARKPKCSVCIISQLCPSAGTFK